MKYHLTRLQVVGFVLVAFLRAESTLANRTSESSFAHSTRGNFNISTRVEFGADSALQYKMMAGIDDTEKPACGNDITLWKKSGKIILPIKIPLQPVL